jgi:hypothetical protein
MHAVMPPIPSSHRTKLWSASMLPFLLQGERETGSRLEEE